jgi:hypothetical protein
MNITIGHGTSVHSTAAHGGTACGAEFRKGRYGVGQISALKHTADAVTCKTCLKKVTAAPAPAPIVVPAPAPAAPRNYVQRCIHCCERHRAPSREQLSDILIACAKARRA